MLKDALDIILDYLKKFDEELVRLKSEEKELKSDLDKIRTYESALSIYLHEISSRKLLKYIWIFPFLAAAPACFTVGLNWLGIIRVLIAAGLCAAAFNYISRRSVLLAEERFNKKNVPGIEELVKNKDNILARCNEIEFQISEIVEMQDRYNEEINFITNFDDMMERIRQDAPEAFLDYLVETDEADKLGMIEEYRNLCTELVPVPFLIDEARRSELLNMFEDYKNEYTSPSKIHFSDVKGLRLNKREM